MVHKVNQSGRSISYIEGCNRNIILLTLKIEFVVEHSVDPDEVPLV